MRLIDVDRITDSDIANSLGMEYCSCAPDIRDMLNDQPTAYDLDGVVNELKREKFVDSETVLSDVHQGYNAGLNRAIDILKDGARSEEKARTTPWISVSERLPEDGDYRYYMCLVENHLEDPPMFCQYEEEYGFGFWKDLYDPVTLGFLDSEFETMEELDYEKVLYWMPMIEPPEEAMQDD